MVNFTRDINISLFLAKRIKILKKYINNLLSYRELHLPLITLYKKESRD